MLEPQFSNWRPKAPRGATVASPWGNIGYFKFSRAMLLWKLCEIMVTMLNCYPLGDIISLQSWIFCSCCDEKQVLCEHQCGTGNEDGHV